jgi:hypothetical protein
MVRDEPASLPHRTLLALALLKQNRARDALAVYANLKVPSNAVSASAVAVHASVLAATGRKDEARAEIAKVPSNRLLPEEAMMVLPLRGAPECVRANVSRRWRWRVRHRRQRR